MTAVPKVLFVTEVPGSTTEGSERLVNELSRALAGEVDLRVHRIAIAPVWAKWTAPLTFPDPADVDVLHYFPIGSLTRGALVRALLWRRRTRRAALVVHAFQYPRRAPPARASRAALGRGGLVVTPSARLLESLARSGVATHHIPPGLDTTHFRPPTPDERTTSRAWLGADAARQVVLHVGHLRRSRNLGTLVALARRAGGSIRVVMVVSPRLPPDAGVEGELMAGGVELLRGAMDVRRAYWGADRYVFPVESPHAAVAVPLSVLEALGCGLPVVTTRFDGLPEALGEHQPGVEWTDGASIVERAHASLARPMPEAATIAAGVDRFRHTAIAARYAALYRELARER